MGVDAVAEGAARAGHRDDRADGQGTALVVGHDYCGFQQCATIAAPFSVP
ncbi:hypothetical protein AB0L49_12230 [Streptomyces antimycoticus]